MTKHIFLTLFLTLLMLTAGKAQPLNIYIEGHVTEEATSDPIDNHWVSFYQTMNQIDDSVTTDPNGFYEFMATVNDTIGYIEVSTFCNGTELTEEILYTSNDTIHTVDFECPDVADTASLTGLISLEMDTFSTGNLAWVYLFGYDDANNNWELEDSVLTDSMGAYVFQDIDTGDYILQTVLTDGSPDYNDFMPTYHYNSLHWGTADQVNVTGTNIQADIEMIAGNNPGGGGSISGNITEAPGKQSEGIHNVLILLLDENGEPVTYTYSESDGSFSFDNIPLGEYQVYAEVINLSTDPAHVSIDSDNPSATDVNIVRSSDGITTFLHPGNALKSDNISIYPNPVSTEYTIDISLNSPENVEITMYNIAGQLQSHNSYNLESGNTNLTFPVQELDEGLYIIVLQGDDFRHHQKLIVE